MDMTCFTFTPPELKKRNLKIVVVYLHEQNEFEVWLSAENKTIQAEYIEAFKSKDKGRFEISRGGPGVESIIEMQVVREPDFDRADDLMQTIEVSTIEFADQISSLICS